MGPHTDPRLATFCNRDVSSRSLAIGSELCEVRRSDAGPQYDYVRELDENYGIWFALRHPKITLKADFSRQVLQHSSYFNVNVS